MKRVLAIAFVSAFVLEPTGAEPPSKVEVSNIRRVFHNGEHNAFTDLIRFQDRFYLTFRSCPDGHVAHSSASVIILASDDAIYWEQVHRFRVEDRDTRDPHFLIFKDKLFVYSGTWYCSGREPCRENLDLNDHLGLRRLVLEWSRVEKSDSARRNPRPLHLAGEQLRRKGVSLRPPQDQLRDEAPRIWSRD